MISRSALAAGASAAIRAGGRRADLRRDAWGHGLLAVAQAVTAAGAEEVIVDSPGEVEALRLEGITATTTGEPDLDPRLLYGLPSAEGLPTTPPVMRLVGRVMSTKRLRAGEAVSYGYTFRAAADTTVAPRTWRSTAHCTPSSGVSRWTSASSTSRALSRRWATR